jgi:hypothetical protein
VEGYSVEPNEEGVWELKLRMKEGVKVDLPKGELMLRM